MGELELPVFRELDPPVTGEFELPLLLDCPPDGLVVPPPAGENVVVNAVANMGRV